jgi:hypothetical protein
VLSLVLIALVACTGGDDGSGSPSAPSTNGARPAATSLRASLLQLRHEEGTTTVHLHLTNTGSEPVEIDSVRLGGPALTSAEATPVVDAARTIAPGELMTAPGAYEPPNCAAPDRPAVLAVALADGQTLQVPMDTDGQQLVSSLVGRDCGLRRIKESVRIRFLPDWRLRTVVGSPAMAGTLALDRRDGASGTLEVVGVRGSVLLDFELLRARQSFTLSPDDDAARLPVALRPAGRCDGHALGQSRQTFLLSVFVQQEGQAEQRLILTPAPDVQDRVLAMVSRACGV